jgi:EAL domain-containing protein (putative c-di-GMP-specific phosphodiesterase class I)
VARVVVQIARAPGLEVIAEGVELPQQPAGLRELGRDLAPGATSSAVR